MFKKMGRRQGLTGISIIALLAVLTLAGWQLRTQPAAPVVDRPLAPSGTNLGQDGPTSATDSSLTDAGNGILIGHSLKNDVSPPLRDLKPIPPLNIFQAPETEHPIPNTGHQDAPDTVVQSSFGPLAAPAVAGPLANFPGIYNSADGGGGCACIPPDTNGEVGPNHFVQSVNSAFAVYNKSDGSLAYGPANINTLWTGFGGACETRNDSDPIVLYDQLADRWLVSQFTSAKPYNECVAISTTSNPTGTWNRYAFQLSTSDFPDYPKLGVWPDGYYMSVNWFIKGQRYGGPRPYVFDRTKMLAGQPATFQTTSAALGSSVSPIMPSDLEGATLPPTGTPNVFVGFGSSMKVYKFQVNWTTPSATTWTQSATLTPAGFTQLTTGVPQKGTTQTLDNLGDRLMNRLTYRNMGTYQTLVVNHSVKTSGPAGVRWYEIRNPAGTPSIYQQGTYAPDSDNRWMGSAAINGKGEIALGYSVSSSATYPSIRYTGRTPNDALGTMGQGENSLVAGTGFQGGYNRWGDYSDLTVDPSDDCTFWFTSEYNPSGTWHWRTQIGSFRVTSCP